MYKRQAYEKEIIGSVDVYLRSIQMLGVVPPVLFFISLLGVKGSFMWVGRRGHSGHFAPKLFDRDMLVSPDIVIEDLECNAAKTLRPAFDMIWSDCGYGRGSITMTAASGHRKGNKYDIATTSMRN